MTFRFVSTEAARQAFRTIVFAFLSATALAAAEKAPFEGKIDVTLSVQPPGASPTVLHTSIFASSIGTLLRARSEFTQHSKSVLELKSKPGVTTFWMRRSGCTGLDCTVLGPLRHSTISTSRNKV